MRIEILQPSCNLETVRDGRGGIFTWLPKDKLAEFNLLYFQPGKTRGNHYHPEFNEYFLVVDGQGVMVTKDSEDAPEELIHMAKGMCVRTPMGVAHAFYAITSVTAVAMLSKPWDDCDQPIVRMDVIDPVGNGRRNGTYHHEPRSVEEKPQITERRLTAENAKTAEKERKLALTLPSP